MISNRMSISLVLCMVQAVAVLNVSCTAGGTRSNSYSVPSGPKSSPQALPSPTQKQTSPIRDVDFKNFTYTWYPIHLKAPHHSRKVSLRDGKFEVVENKQAGIDNLILELDDVSYVDLTGDGREEAIVPIAGIETFNSFLNGIFIYTVEEGGPRLLWHHETGDRADGGLRRIAVEDRTLVIEQYARSEGDGGLCCPKKFIRSYYRWNGEHFGKIKSETLPNEYDNARFLGYPTEQS